MHLLMLIESNQRIRDDVDDGGCHDVHHVGVDVGIYSLIVPFVLLDISSASIRLFAFRSMELKRSSAATI